MTERSASPRCIARPAPCDACAQQQRCFLSGIACRDFSAYIASARVVNRDRQPTRRRLARLMNAEA